jgi:hypothetical protein
MRDMDQDYYEVFNENLVELHKALWADVDPETSYHRKKPFLAHYTSITALERIMASNELWFSSPFFMNDIQELWYGIEEGARAFRTHKGLKAVCHSDERYNLLMSAFEHQLNRFQEKDAFDTYVFCTSEYDSKNADGLLSMWRGYGSNGNGAAIVFDTSQFRFNSTESILIVAPVEYRSESQRLEWINNKISEFASLLVNAEIADEKIYLAVHLFLERLKIFSLFTKHQGFSEELEWRAVYLRENDLNHRADSMLHYTIGSRGLEPKLKLKVEPIPGLTGDDFSIEKIVYRIILGPSASSPLALKTVKRMLEKVEKHKLAEKVFASSTPFRSR